MTEQDRQDGDGLLDQIRTIKATCINISESEATRLGVISERCDEILETLPIDLGPQNRAFHAALQEYPDSFEALHYFWNEAFAPTSAPPKPAPDAMRELPPEEIDCGEIHRKDCRYPNCGCLTNSELVDPDYNSGPASAIARALSAPVPSPDGPSGKMSFDELACIREAIARALYDLHPSWSNTQFSGPEPTRWCYTTPEKQLAYKQADAILSLPVQSTTRPDKEAAAQVIAKRHYGAKLEDLKDGTADNCRDTVTEIFELGGQVRVDERETQLLLAAIRMRDLLTADGDPPSIIIPDDIDANTFAQAFHNLAEAISQPPHSSSDGERR